jgi:hypothetical protein
MGETIKEQSELTHPEMPPIMQYKPRKKNRPLTIFQWAVIIIAGSGFTFKFVEFTYSIFKTGNELVQFAVTPIVMYSCVAVGFFMMFLWTVIRGDYKDIERPKYRLFEREVELGDKDLLNVNDETAVGKIISMPISKN